MSMLSTGWTQKDLAWPEWKIDKSEPGLKINLCNKKIIILFLNQNICCGVYSKEPSHWDGSFEHQKHMLQIMGKEILTSFR